MEPTLLFGDIAEVRGPRGDGARIGAAELAVTAAAEPAGDRDGD